MHIMVNMYIIIIHYTSYYSGRKLLTRSKMIIKLNILYF